MTKLIKMLPAIIFCLLWVGMSPASAQPQQAADAAAIIIPAGSVLPQNIQAECIIDYGSFRWAILSAGQARAARQIDESITLIESPYVLTLGGESFDPLSSTPPFAPHWQASSRNSNEPALHLVQFKAPIKEEWIKALEKSGLEVVQYIHPYTYVVWGDAASLNKAAIETPYLRWVGDFLPAYKVLPGLRSTTTHPLGVQVLLYRQADVNATIGQITALGVEVQSRAPIDASFEAIVLAAGDYPLAQIAALPAVYTIHPISNDGGRGEVTSQINAGNINASNYALPGYQAWLASIGLSGSGVTVAVVDGGVNENHPDLVNRMTTCTGSSCSTVNDNHGTHVAGIIAGDGSSGVVNSSGFLRGLGVAPGATLFEQVYYPTYTQANGLLLLMTQSYNNGASLSSNSWGPSMTPTGYDADTRQVDVGVRDADPNAAGSQPLLYVLSIMNGGGGTSSQGSPDEAKNSFTIGSTMAQSSANTQYTTINDLSANSAHGPALDGRNIPHLVAPGCNVDSTVINGHGTMCGTSMASPQVSGAAALFIQYYRNLTGLNPSPALVKAAFLPVAHNLAGFKDADGGILGNPFDSKQGWGRLNLPPVLQPDSVLYFDQTFLFNQTGETWQLEIYAVDAGKPLRVMLVWTDAPGHGLGGSTPAWNNDLNLAVSQGAVNYYGNVFGSNGWSVSGGAADVRNNTEGVLIGPTASGIYSLTVTAANITSDGVPHIGDGTDQDFALVCYNCAFAGLTYFPVISR